MGKQQKSKARTQHTHTCVWGREHYCEQRAENRRVIWNPERERERLSYYCLFVSSPLYLTIYAGPTVHLSLSFFACQPVICDMKGTGGGGAQISEIVIYILPWRKDITETGASEYIFGRVFLFSFSFFFTVVRKSLTGSRKMTWRWHCRYLQSMTRWLPRRPSASEKKSNFELARAIVARRLQMPFGEEMTASQCPSLLLRSIKLDKYLIARKARMAAVNWFELLH